MVNVAPFCSAKITQHQSYQTRVQQTILTNAHSVRIMNLLLEAFLLGIAYGIGPCTWSCAPVLVPLVVGSSKGTMHGLLQTIWFSAGRITVYILLGFLMGLFGKALNLELPSSAFGVFLVFLGTMVIIRLPNRCLYRSCSITRNHMAFVAGLVMGISPCLPLVAALGLSVASKSAVTGAAIALVFGLGTSLSPLLLIGPLSGRMGSIKEFQQVNSWVAGGLLVLLGILYLFR